MKKYVITLAILAAALSCTKEASVGESAENNRNVKLVEMTFTVSSETDNALTKAVMNPDRSVEFSPGDEIAVFANGNKYKFTTSAGGPDATFTGMGEIASVYYALFPYSENATISGGVISGVNLAQAASTSVTGTFAPRHAIFVAKSNTTALSFKSAVALLKLTVPATVTDLQAVSVFSRENTSLSAALSGTFDLTPGDGAPVVNVTAKNGAKDTPHTTGIEAEDRSAGGTLAPGEYYIPVLPATLTKGLDMKLDYKDGTVDRPANPSAVTFQTGKVYNMGTVNKVGGYVLFSFENMATDYLKDKDKNIGGGNESSLSVADNPLPTDATNTSAKVMKIDMTTRAEGSGTSGVVKLKNLSHMPSGWFRTFFNTIQIKIYTAGDIYYPQATIDADSGKGYKEIRPNRVNGVTVTSETEFKAAYKADGWNILEWDYTSINNGTAIPNNAKQGMVNIQFRFFRKDWTGNNAARPAYNLLCYVDDITLLI